MALPTKRAPLYTGNPIVKLATWSSVFRRRTPRRDATGRLPHTGIADPRLLTARHIKPWGKDSENRHNPANGLLLSATLDRAFDRGLITVDRQRRIRVSRQLRESQSRETRDYFQQFENATLRSAIRFDPEPAFLDWHNEHCFVDQRAA